MISFDALIAFPRIVFLPTSIQSLIIDWRVAVSKTPFVHYFFLRCVIILQFIKPWSKIDHKSVTIKIMNKPHTGKKPGVISPRRMNYYVKIFVLRNVWSLKTHFRPTFIQQKGRYYLKGINTLLWSIFKDTWRG